jgi:hypothetical protein
MGNMIFSKFWYLLFFSISTIPYIIYFKINSLYIVASIILFIITLYFIKKDGNRISLTIEKEELKTIFEKNKLDLSIIDNIYNALDNIKSIKSEILKNRLKEELSLKHVELIKTVKNLNELKEHKKSNTIKENFKTKIMKNFSNNKDLIKEAIKKKENEIQLIIEYVNKINTELILIKTAGQLEIKSIESNLNNLINIRKRYV